MSMVVKGLEDVVNVESDLHYFFWNSPLPNIGAGVDNEEVHVACSLLLHERASESTFTHKVDCAK
jgi:hypothetical protein